MAFVIDGAFLPATLTAPPMTDEEFADFCAEHPELVFEMTAEGELIVMPPSFSMDGVRNCAITAELHNWAKRDGRGVGCGASAGFVLPNGARRSADVSWTLKSRVAGGGFWHLCPDFVIELQSGTERARFSREKMQEWIANGARLAWLIDPSLRSVTIYRPGGSVETRTNIDSIAGEGPVADFVLDLTDVWDPLGA
jgi:Uma2 family endonuclease